MNEYCPYCGTRMQRTSWNRSFCPNCGIIEEIEEENDEKERRYIG